MKLAKSQKMKASLSRDKIIIDGKPYSIDDIGSLPVDTSSISSVTTDDYVFFHGRMSVFSNFCRSHFEIDDHYYCCVEQCFQRAKAVNAKEDAIAAEIMLCTDPAQMKRLGDSISSSTWTSEIQIQHMTQALFAKFDQNRALHRKLMDTNQRKFVETNPYDQFWSIGKGLRDPDLSDTSTWKGRNTLGLLLNSMRDRHI
jgi:ribA/ribD-fused uncharacterized protein